MGREFKPLPIGMPRVINPEVLPITVWEASYIHFLAQKTNMFEDMEAKHPNHNLTLDYALQAVIILTCRFNKEYPEDIERLMPAILPHLCKPELN